MRGYGFPHMVVDSLSPSIQCLELGGEGGYQIEKVG